MNAILVALFSAFLAMTMGTLILRKHARPAKYREQSFRFHDLRDRLQVLAVEGKIDRGSSAYDFLEFTINLAIRNAGVMKLSEVLRLSKTIESRMAVKKTEDVFASFRRQDEQVQNLAADVFNSLGVMLISNDDLTYVLAKVVELGANKVKGLARLAVKKIASVVFPERSAALSEAKKFRHWGSALTPNAHV